MVRTAYKHLFVAGALLSLALAACSSEGTSGGESSSRPSREASSSPPPKPTPKVKAGTLDALISCACDFEYEIARTSKTVVRVTDPIDGAPAIVELMPSNKAARDGARAADLLDNKVVGRFWFKYGPRSAALVDDLISTCELTP